MTPPLRKGPSGPRADGVTFGPPIILNDYDGFTPVTLTLAPAGHTPGIYLVGVDVVTISGPGFPNEVDVSLTFASPGAGSQTQIFTIFQTSPSPGENIDMAGSGGFTPAPRSGVIASSGAVALEAFIEGFADPAPPWLGTIYCTCALVAPFP